MTVHLTKDSFKTLVFDYEKNKEWNFAGQLPAIVDFYADWCGPCKMLSPVLEELSAEYNGRLNVYKINTEDEPELAALFGVSSIPTLLFIPKDGKPQVSVGALPKAALKDAISTVLKI